MTNFLEKSDSSFISQDGQPIEGQIVTELGGPELNQTTVVEVEKGQSYRVVDLATQQVVKPIKVERVDKNLLVTLEDGDVLEMRNYFDDDEANNAEFVFATGEVACPWVVIESGVELAQTPILDANGAELLWSSVDPSSVDACAYIAWAGTANSSAAVGVLALGFGPAGVAASLLGLAVTGAGAGAAPVLAPGPVLGSVVDDAGRIKRLVDSGDVTDDATLAFMGSGATPGDLITLYDTSVVPPVVLGSTVVTAEGNWYVTPINPLAEGPHAFQFTTTNSEGTESAQSTPAFLVSVDTSAPDAPVVGEVVDDSGVITGPLKTGDQTDDSQPKISGSGGTPGEIIRLYDTSINPAKELGEGVVDENGEWVVTPTTPLPEGSHTLQVTVSDSAGNESQKSTPTIVLVIDTVAPQTPVLTGINDDVGAVTGEIAEGASTDDNLPTLTGSGVAGDTIRVLDNGKLLGTTVVAEDGSWTFTPKSPLTNGDHAITVTAIDPSGNASLPTQAQSFTLIPSSSSAAPAVGNVIDDQGSIQGFVPKGTGITDDSRPEIQGSGAEGDVISVYDGATLLGQTTVGPDGLWSFTPEADLADGTHEISVINENDEAAVPTGTYDFVVDTRAPAALSGIEVQDDVGPQRGGITPGSTTDDATPTMSGQGEAGATVYVYDNGGSRPIGSTTVAEDGTWSFTPTSALINGTHSLSARQVDGAGNQSALSDPIEFTIDTTGLTEPTITRVSDDQEPSTGHISMDGVTNDTTPTVTGTALAGSTLNVYDGETLLGSATAKANGSWSFTPATALADGAHALSVKVVSADGAEGSASASYGFTIDTAAPSAPVIGVAQDDVGTLQGDVQTGGVSDDTTPSLQGTGEPGSVIEVYEGDILLGSTKVQPDGTWTLTPTSSLGEGTHTLTATSTDESGNVSEIGEAFEYTVDTVAPQAPLSAPVSYSDDAGVMQSEASIALATDDSTPAIQIEKNLIDTPKLYVNGQYVASTYDAVSGLLKPDVALTNGPQVFTYSLVDAARNESAQSPEFTLTIDTIAPTVSNVVIASAEGALNNTLNAGDTITVDIDFSKVVTAAGSPTVNLNIGGELVPATYVSGSGTSTLKFTATVLSGNDADGISIDANALSFSGGSIYDGVGNMADLSHDAVTANADYMVDTVAPVIGEVDWTTNNAKGNGFAKPGDSIFTTFTSTDPVVEVTIIDIPAPVTYLGNNVYQAEHVVKETDPNVETWAVIRAVDLAGNVTIVDTRDPAPAPAALQIPQSLAASPVDASPELSSQPLAALSETAAVDGPTESNAAVSNANSDLGLLNVLSPDDGMQALQAYDAPLEPAPSTGVFPTAYESASPLAVSLSDLFSDASQGVIGGLAPEPSVADAASVNADLPLSSTGLNEPVALGAAPDNASDPWVMGDALNSYLADQSLQQPVI